MTSTTVQVFIPFESLLDSVKRLSTNEKRRLWEILEEQFGDGQYEITKRSMQPR